MTELKPRSTEDLLIAAVDGLEGFPDANTSIFPESDSVFRVLADAIQSNGIGSAGKYGTAAGEHAR